MKTSLVSLEDAKYVGSREKDLQSGISRHHDSRTSANLESMTFPEYVGFSENALERRMLRHNERRGSTTSDSMKLELRAFLKDFTFSDDILNKRREWL